MIKKRQAFFLMVDMIISLLIVSVLLMTIFKGIEILNFRRDDSSDIIKLRNEITCAVTNKEAYVRENNLTPVRTYRICDDIFVEIYEFVIDEEIKRRHNFKNIEFGLISKGKGE